MAAFCALSFVHAGFLQFLLNSRIFSIVSRQAVLEGREKRKPVSYWEKKYFTKVDSVQTTSTRTGPCLLCLDEKRELYRGESQTTSSCAVLCFAWMRGQPRLSLLMLVPQSLCETVCFTIFVMEWPLGSGLLLVPQSLSETS